MNGKYDVGVSRADELFEIFYQCRLQPHLFRNGLIMYCTHLRKKKNQKSNHVHYLVSR